MFAGIASALLLLASLSAQAWAQQPQPAPPPAAAIEPQASSLAPRDSGFSIAGVVENALTGQPMPSVSVAIARVTQGAERNVSQSVISGPDGRFSFSGLSQGKYSLIAQAQGFTRQAFDSHGGYATAIAVGPSLDSEHLVFRLQPDAFIEGDVSDDNNEPIQNAEVRLFQKRTEGGEDKTVPINQVQADDQGHYRIGHLEAGTYYLAVSARPWYAQNFRSLRPTTPEADAAAAQQEALLDVTYPLTFYPDATDSTDATPVQLHPGARETADIVLHATPSLHLRVHTGNLAGSAALGRMIFPRVSQRVFEGYLQPVFNAPDSWVSPGVIEVSGLAPGHYVVEMPDSSGLGQKDEGRSWYREIDLAGDMDISASEGPSFVSLSGAISFEGLSRPPHEASIRLLNPETGERFRSDIDEKGELDFRSDEIRPGRYVVALENADRFFLSRFSATGAKVIGSTLVISVPGSVRLAGVASRGAAQVDGTVLRNGKPFPGAMVVLVPHDPTNNSPLFRRDQSDSDGTFTLANVVPGQYTVIAIADGWDLEWTNPAVLDRYLKKGEAVQAQPESKLKIDVQTQ